MILFSLPVPLQKPLLNGYPREMIYPSTYSRHPRVIILLELIPILIAVGVGAGALGSILGVGGGVIIVPFLTYFGLSPTQTSSTSLFSVLSTSVASTVEYSRQKRIDYALGLRMAAAAAPGAIVGALLSRQFTTDSFRLYFGILLILTGLYILNRGSLLNGRSLALMGSHKNVIVYAFAFAAGMISSLFGVGGGIIFVPVMLLFLGVGIHRAAATSQLTLLVTSFAGIITHAYLGNPDYAYASALALGAFIGGQIGARISKSAKEKLLEKVLGIVLMGIGLRLIIDWFLKAK